MHDLQLAHYGSLGTMFNLVFPLSIELSYFLMNFFYLLILGPTIFFFIFLVMLDLYIISSEVVCMYIYIYLFSKCVCNI